MSSDYARIEKAIRYLAAHAGEQPSLRQLSGKLGLSEFHCHRLFKRWAGITPKDFVQFVTLAQAKRLLEGEASVLDASLGSGLSGASRLHDLFVRYEAMTPGEFRDGVEIRWARFETPLGLAALAETDRGICYFGFVETERQAVQEIRARWPSAALRKAGLKPLVSEIVARMRGEGRAGFKLALSGSAFQVKVWEALLRIPEGRVTTYRELAQLIGMPSAARAVGSAVGANPIGYLIPCHRVIRSTGVIGDYAWGSSRKTALLAMESVRSLRVGR